MDLDPAIISLAFIAIKDEWQAIPAQHRPWGVWITQHLPISADHPEIDKITQTVLRAWFLQNNDLPPQPRNIWEYIRLIVVQFEQPWNILELPVPGEGFTTARGKPCYDIGFARFAPISTTGDLCLETQWGGLWGRGRRVSQTTPGVLTEVELIWIS